MESQPTAAHGPSGGSRGGRQRWRRPRRGGGNGGGNQQDTANANSIAANSASISRDASMALRPASVAPAATPNPAPQSNHIPQQDGGRGRARRGGRGGRSRGGARGGPQGQTPLMAGSRVFGEQLTSSENASQAGQGDLKADAPEFRPGQSHSARSNPQHQPRARRMSKSMAPDLATRIHEDIAHSLYECPICTSEVLRNSKIWSCNTCWSVFHLTCVKKWAKNEGSRHQQEQAQNGDIPPPRQWRCPGCNLPKDTMPTNYSCWCAKEVDPKPIAGLPPHSCGQTCSKDRAPKKCPHACDLACHAGPCPPCSYMGPEQPCFCGKKSSKKRCMETDYDNGWSCGKVCGDIMPCGEHECPRGCHEGLCGECEIPVEARCYCGKVEKLVKCSDRGNEKSSKKEHDEWIGSFACRDKCSRPFDCGKHICEKDCHTQDEHPAKCPLSPELITHCPCGKTKLSKLLEEPRQSCEDKVPHCKEVCDQSLPCGHRCRNVCHTGPCAPCFTNVEIDCRCGRTHHTTICHQGHDEPPQCRRICKVTLNCGRHECSDRCCSGEKKAIERQANKRKMRPLGSNSRIVDEGFEAEHVCLRTCGRLLKCGNHSCEELCHKGPCRSCREAIFDEISCRCGRTILHPPLPCGTPPPPCRFPCDRSTACGHPRVPHNCHGDEENCPKCPYLVQKMCLCGRNSLKNQPCFFREVRCGEVCEKKLKCGNHTCLKQCHRNGECEDATKPCSQPCGRPKTVCGHSCLDPCHAPYPCKEDASRPCQSKILITCDCQRQKVEMRCFASKAGVGNTEKTLSCDDECARLIRNQKLASALNIDPATHADDHIPYSQDTLNMYKELPAKWSQTQEREIRVFAADDQEKRLRFQPMKPHQRAFVHSLAQDFGLDSESMDPEPHRHVIVLKTPKFVSAPMKTLGQCVKLRPTAESIIVSQKKKANNFAPFNAFVLSAPRFALTIEEVRSGFADNFNGLQELVFEISFLPSEEIVLKATSTNPSATNEESISATLTLVKPLLTLSLKTHDMAKEISLCRVDSSLNVVRREEDPSLGGGWSHVAAKGSAPFRAPARYQNPNPVGNKSQFTVLGNLAAKKAKAKRDREEAERKRREAENAPESWEDAEESIEFEESVQEAVDAVDEFMRSGGGASGATSGAVDGGVDKVGEAGGFGETGNSGESGESDETAETQEVGSGEGAPTTSGPV